MAVGGLVPYLDLGCGLGPTERLFAGALFCQKNLCRQFFPKKSTFSEF